MRLLPQAELLAIPFNNFAAASEAEPRCPLSGGYTRLMIPQKKKAMENETHQSERCTKGVLDLVHRLRCAFLVFFVLGIDSYV